VTRPPVRPGGPPTLPAEQPAPAATDTANWPARLRHTAAELRADAADSDHPVDVALASALADVLEERATLNWFSAAPPGWIHAPALLDAVDRLAEVLAAALDTTTDDTDEGTAP
jgi:hypothetical protein